MLDQITLDLIHVIPMHDLSPLLTHPDFQSGVTSAHEDPLDDYGVAPLTEDEMIALVEDNVSRRVYTRSVSSMQGNHPSFFRNLGYVYGVINLGLSAFITDYDLSALMEHPDVLQGVDDAQKGFHYEYEPAPLSEDEMITLVEDTLSRPMTQRSKEMFGDDGPPYLWSLGHVFGMINEGLTYSYTIG